MTDLLRQEIITSVSRIVVKVGTRVLTHSDGKLNEPRITHLADELNAVAERGKQVVLVSSGAVGAGMNALNLTTRPTDVAQLQAVAAIGQTNLINAYDRTFRKNNHHAAQVLLTAQDLDDRVAYLNVRNTLFSLLRFGAIPVINENDTVAVDELMTTFGDNDRLAAMVTNLLNPSLLIILSDVEGLLDGDPADAESRVIPTVTKLDDSIRRLVTDSGSDVSKGGMASKLEAARIATAAGENVIVASGHRKGVLSEILDAKQVGTLFLAQGKAITPRKRWIGFSAQPCGTLTLDRGAHRAIVDLGRSLLAIGISAVDGDFRKGDVVRLVNDGEAELARGLTNYDSTDLQKIRGLASDKIAQVLGHCPYKEVIHRDNLTVIERPA